MYGLDFHPVGWVNLGQLDHFSPEIGYAIGDTSLWGKGIATEGVRLAIEWIKEYAQTHKHIVAVHTTIKDDNLSSIRVVEKLGFTKGMEARKGEHFWQRRVL